MWIWLSAALLHTVALSAPDRIALIGCGPESSELEIRFKSGRPPTSPDPWNDPRLRLTTRKRESGLHRLARCEWKGDPPPIPSEVEVVASTPEISKIQNFGLLLPREGVLTFSILFGLLEPKGRKLDPKELARKLTAAKLPWGDQGERIFRWDMKLEKPETHLEPGAMELLSFIRHLKTYLEPTAIRVERSDRQSIDFEIHGRLRRSAREAKVRVYFGPTPGHERSFRTALESADVVLYSGHAGQGRNLRVDRLRRFNPLQRYQLLGLFNCLSYSYFGEDLLDRRKGLATDLILSTTTDAGNYYVTQMMRTLDENLAGKAVDLEKAFERRKEFLVLKRTTP